MMDFLAAIPPVLASVGALVFLFVNFVYVLHPRTPGSVPLGFGGVFLTLALGLVAFPTLRWHVLWPLLVDPGLTAPLLFYRRWRVQVADRDSNRAPE